MFPTGIYRNVLRCVQTVRQVVRLHLYEGLSLEVPSYTDCTEVPSDIKKADIQDKNYPPLV